MARPKREKFTAKKTGDQWSPLQCDFNNNFPLSIFHFPFRKRRELKLKKKYDFYIDNKKIFC